LQTYNITNLYVHLRKYTKTILAVVMSVTKWMLF